MPSKPQLKYIRSLHQKKFRDQNKVYIAEGIKIVNEVIQRCNSTIEMLVFTAKAKMELKTHQLPDNIAFLEVNESDFSRISAQKSPQGALAIIKQNQDQLPENLPQSSLSLVLEGARDPGNLGTIIRIADWFGIENIFCSEDTVDRYNPKVVQASMGAILRVKLYYFSLPYILEKYSTQATIYSTTLEGENIYKTALNVPALLILGNEANGISKELIQHSDKSLLIPNYSKSTEKSESLNVSMAAGIACAEFCRQFAE